MEFIRGLNNVKPHHKGCVLTIGKFDGVHRGHQAVLANVLEKAKSLSLPATVMVFEPQPEEVFMPDKAPARISPLREKYELLSQQGVDRLLAVRFNARKGDFEMLEAAGRQYGFEVVSTHSFTMHAHRISSTAVREALANSDFGLSTEMLGRPFAIHGRVVHGEKKGRTIGFPTANVMLKRQKTPIHGVFAVRVDVDGKHYNGVANIGTRPTVNGVRNQLEVHIFDLSSDLYGKPITVFPMAKIRDEIKFDSFEALKDQIQADAAQARLLLA